MQSRQYTVDRVVDAKAPNRIIATNLAWLVTEKFFSICDAVLVGAMVARYLGPTQLGYISYATALMAIGTSMASLGLDRVVIRDLIRSEGPLGSSEGCNRKNQGAESFWGLVFFRTTGGLLLFAAINSALLSGLLGNRAADELKVIQYTSIGLLLLPLAAPVLILEANLLTKWSVWVSTFWLAISSVIRVVLVVFGASVDTFVLASQFHAFAIAVTLILVICHSHLLPPFRLPSVVLFTSLLRECWPLAISSLAVAFYMSIDVTMLRWMRGPDSAGTYSVAVQMSAVWYFLPMAIASSYLPWLARSHEGGLGEYPAKLRAYIDVNVDAAVVCLLAGLLVFPFIIRTLFGPHYYESISVFRIHAFSLFFVFVGVARSQHLLLEGLHRVTLLTTCLGAAVNVIANLILIPRFGGYGAAIGTLLAYSVAGHASSFACQGTRDFGRQVHLSLLAAPSRLLASARRFRKILLPQ